MITSGTRTTRSRYASPAQTQTGTWNGTLDMTKSTGSEGSRAFMARWLEPQVQAKPSFEDDGLMRYGVLENMAPLGSLPKSKKAGNETSTTARKIILRTSGTTAAANSAPEVTPKSPAASPPPPPELPPTPPRRRSLAIKDPDDEDYEPKGGSRRRQSGRTSLARKRRRSSGARMGSITVSKPVTPKEKETSRPLPEPEDKEFVDKVIEVAVDEALKHYRYPTAWALRTLYDEKCGDARFVAMVEQVFNQSADAATLKKFTKQIEEKKREGKKDNLGCYYFVPPPTNNRFTPRKPKPAPYGKLLHSSDEHPQSETRAAKKAKTSHSRDTPRKMSINGEVHTPSRRRGRRDSASSDSSLSSAMSLSSPEESVSVKVIAAAGVSRDLESESRSPTFRGATTRQGPESKDAPKSRPITTRGKSLAAKQARSSPSGSNSPTLPVSSTTNPPSNSIHVEASMPGKISSAALFPTLSTKKSKAAKEARRASMPGDESFWDRRKDAQRLTNSIHVAESSVRGGDEDEEATPTKKTRRTRHSLAPSSITTRATRSASKRPHEEVEIASSPAAWSFPGGDGSSTVGSRAVTPTTLRPPKKARKGLRIKSSPVKKKGGTAAGVPRSMGEAHSSAANGQSKDQISDNDEYCSACGNAGDVVCCDGCPRSFHFECVDMAESESLPDEWYCNECFYRVYPSRMPRFKGVFAISLYALEKTIPRAFSLPKSLQTRFEGVKAGSDGEYEEVTTTKTVKKKNGYEEVPDFFRQRDDGQAVLCHDCQKPATDVRAIIHCSVCPLYWHLDCLDPPLAMPPVLKTWRCPAHVDETLTEAHPLAPAHKHRKIKGAESITPALSRGLKNNGHIEVDWSDEEPERPNKSGWQDPDSFGRPHKLPAKGIVLDFIEQLRRQGAGYGIRQEEPRWLTIPHAGKGPLRGSALTRTVEEMQVALNLTTLKERKSDKVDQLVSALQAGAGPDVMALMAKTNANNIASGHLTEDDKLGLRALLVEMDAIGARIRQKLGDDAPSADVAAPSLEQGSALDILSPEDSAIADPDEKFTAPPPVTEPTPPLTIDNADGSMELD